MKIYFKNLYFKNKRSPCGLESHPHTHTSTQSAESERFCFFPLCSRSPASCGEPGVSTRFVSPACVDQRRSIPLSLPPSLLCWPLDWLGSSPRRNSFLSCSGGNNKSCNRTLSQMFVHMGDAVSHERSTAFFGHLTPCRVGWFASVDGHDYPTGVSEQACVHEPHLVLDGSVINHCGPLTRQTGLGTLV